MESVREYHATSDDDIRSAVTTMTSEGFSMPQLVGRFPGVEQKHIRTTLSDLESERVLERSGRGRGVEWRRV